MPHNTEKVHHFQSTFMYQKLQNSLVKKDIFWHLPDIRKTLELGWRTNTRIQLYLCKNNFWQDQDFKNKTQWFSSFQMNISSKDCNKTWFMNHIQMDSLVYEILHITYKSITINHTPIFLEHISLLKLPLIPTQAICYRQFVLTLQIWLPSNGNRPTLPKRDLLGKINNPTQEPCFRFAVAIHSHSWIYQSRHKKVTCELQDNGK